MKSPENNLAFPIERHGRERPDHPALVVGGERLGYGMLAARAKRLAGFLDARRRTGRVGILGSRSAEALTGILGTAWSGGTYVPLGLKLPEERLVQLFAMLDLDALVVDRRGAALLTEAVRAAAPAAIVVPEGLEDQGTYLSQMDETAAMTAPVPVEADHLAYIEFTSGTTGVPKGVEVSCGAVESYMRATQDWYGFAPADRAAETCDITFDLSVHNMFAAWREGATVHVMTSLEMMAPAQFIRKHAITTWLSVPAVVAMMRRNGTLKEASLPSLRLSLFCGEPLPVAAAEAWQKAAPGSVVDNIYGPTEATIACLRQPWSDGGRVTEERGIVAIGKAYPGMEAAVVDADLKPLPSGERGEIALAGAQLARGYFGQPELTAKRFPTIAGKRWYLTGDLGMMDADGVFHHLGRLDNQVKVQGNRVELEEVEAGLRRVTGADLVAAVAWPVRHGSAEGIVGFTTKVEKAPELILADLNKLLPAYMVPQRMELVETMPLNANGKVDRRALLATLDA